MEERNGERIVEVTAERGTRSPETNRRMAEEIEAKLRAEREAMRDREKRGSRRF